MAARQAREEAASLKLNIADKARAGALVAKGQAEAARAATLAAGPFSKAQAAWQAGESHLAGRRFGDAADSFSQAESLFVAAGRQAGEAAERERQRSVVDAARRRAEAARGEAEAAGARTSEGAAVTFNRAVDTLTRAKAHLDAGRFSDAERGYAEAEGLFREAAAAARKPKAPTDPLHLEALAAKQDMEDAKAKVRAVPASKQAYYDAATKSETQADQALAEGDYKRATGLYERATTFYKVVSP